ncbi:response regulator [Micromonospora sp. ATA32]|nr:response regulator [Micromonospora sp. ATA32]
MIRLLLADDQAVVRAGLRTILESRSDLEVVGEAADGAEAVTLAKTLEPDVVLMDIRMPVLDGIEATRRLARATARSRVLVLTMVSVLRHPSHAAALAPATDRPTLDLSACAARPATGRPGAPRAGAAPGRGEPDMGASPRAG